MLLRQTDSDFDVFIIGAGPAGTAAAISLREIIPDIRVCIADGGKTAAFRIGESVPPPIKPFLDQLGVTSAFAQAEHSPSFRTLNAWGSARLESNEFLLHVHQTGWRLNRAHFDVMLKTEAMRRGAIFVPARVTSLTGNAHDWRIECSNAEKFSARYIVDASGGAAIAARKLKFTPRKLDRLIACAVFFAGQAQQSSTIDANAPLIEACQHGWWYTAAIPDNKRVVMLMTDTDIARRLGIARMPTWLRHLSLTDHIQACTGMAPPLTQPLVFPASSRYFADTYPFGIVPAGDAVSRFDPLSSQGIVKALRSALYASYAIADHHLKGDTMGFSKYFTLMRDEFEHYATTWQTYYRQEQRWPDAPFWQRRHGMKPS
jgi:2-polyprenyl-6-methoxyphenol hydroxylase-like FAD-dependent oxidoreductase